MSNNQLEENKLKIDKEAPSSNHNKHDESHIKENQDMSFDDKELELILKNRLSCRSIAYNIVNHKNCIPFYFGLIFVSFSSFLLSIISYLYNVDEKYVLIIEFILMFIMVIDLIIRIIAFGFMRFFKMKFNIIDVVLIILSIVSVGLYARYYFNSVIGELEDIVIVSLLVLRNITQFIRIYVLFKNHKKIKVSLTN